MTCSRGAKIQPDVALADVVGTAFDLIYLPGGMEGMRALSKVRHNCI